MISVQEARACIQQHSNVLPAVLLPVQQAVGLVLATDIYAVNDIPAFPQSAMDGYAFAYNDWQQGYTLQISGAIAAGDSAAAVLLPQQAVRIFTGAPVPAGADTVVMQEKTLTHKFQLTITDSQLQSGANIRPAGSEVTKNSLALAKNSVLTPAAIGFLAGIGYAHVPVYPRPVIHLLVTGDELQAPGAPLLPGQVYESNSYSLIAALQQLMLPVHVTIVKDNLAALQQAVSTALAQCDLLLLTGGISVGDYDFVATALATCGVQQRFHKISQKPGKPLDFGTRQQQLVFGLPGNPASVLTCFYEYVVPALEQAMGITNSRVIHQQLPLTASYRKKKGFTHFLKGICNQQQVTVLPAQESYKLSSFAVANCLVCIGEETEEVAAGTMVDVHLFPE
jgi:molybdopterin molybdotransferase